MKKKIGFIGCGNIGQAILDGLIASKIIQSTQIYVFTPSIDKIAELHDKYGINIAHNAHEVVQASDIIFSAVKSDIALKVLSEVASDFNKNSLLVSIAAGVTLYQLAYTIGHDRKIIRSMPNIPILVNSGMTFITPNALVTSADIADITTIFCCCGQVKIIPESMIHQLIGISSSAPAYVFILIEAMADAAVLGGMSRIQAYNFAAYAVMGAAKMVLETDKHPGELKDMVCSPGGTTIEAVKVLEERGFRAAIIEAIIQCMRKSKKLETK